MKSNTRTTTDALCILWTRKIIKSTIKNYSPRWPFNHIIRNVKSNKCSPKWVDGGNFIRWTGTWAIASYLKHQIITTSKLVEYQNINTYMIQHSILHKSYNDLKYLAVNHPLRQKRIITCRSNWSKPRWANLILQLIHPKKLSKPCVSLFFLPQRKPVKVSSVRWSFSQNATVATMTIKYTTCHAKYLLEKRASEQY